MKMIVILTPAAQADFDALPLAIKVRVSAVFVRLQDYPNVSGAKPLRYRWKGHFRIRVGAWRVIFYVVSPHVVVVRIDKRSDVYDD